MKANRRLITAASALLLLLVAAGCGTSSVSLNLLQPAQINVREDVKSLVLVNRYRPDKGQKFWNFMEGLLTGEGIGEDRKGAEASLFGLSNVLRNSPRFSTTQANIEVPGSGLGTFPPPLSSDEVKRICNQFNSHAMVTVEAFDSDSDLKYGTRQVEEKTKEGQKVTRTIHTVTANVRITVGWRLYSAIDGSLLDEFMMQQGMGFNAEGPNQAAARNNLPSRENMTQDLGAKAGDAYARRISPNWIWVNRMYYSGGTPTMKAARNAVRVSNWELAEKLWKESLEDPKKKIPSKAAYNLALAEEMKGDLQAGVKWTQKSAEMGCRAAYDYNRVLLNRIADLQRLNDQMKAVE
ncbi:MAG: tetratricopeptide repeat protein [Bacteroidia bacterium]|nr:tetratricopeptide repeat protein [Bacteroidia bacterium]